MRIGVVVDNEYFTDVRVKREVRLLREFGYQVSVLCLSFKKEYDYREEGVVIVPVYLQRKIKNMLFFFMNLLPFYEWWWSRQVRKFITQQSINVIHTHDLYMSKAVRRGITSSGGSIPMILDLHENFPHAIRSYKWTQGLLRSLLARPESWKKKELRYLRYADQLIVLSEDFKQSLINRYAELSEDKITVFPNVVDTVEFDSYEVSETLTKDLPEGPRVLYFGVVAHRRGIFRALKVCEELLSKGKQFSLIVIGPVDGADKQHFSDEIAKPVFKEKLLYKPWIDLSELPSYLAACDIALAPFEKNPQHESGVANKIFQYMYGKLPIVASNCKPQQELIEGNQIGLIFDTDEKFAESLSVLIEDDEKRKKMGHKAHEVLMTSFHQDTFSPGFRRLYEQFE